MIYHTLLFTYMFWSLLRPLSGCFARIPIKYFIIIIRNELGRIRPVSASFDSLFESLPSRLRPFGLLFCIIFGILLLFILITCGQFDFYMFRLKYNNHQGVYENKKEISRLHGFDISKPNNIMLYNTQNINLHAAASIKSHRNCNNSCEYAEHFVLSTVL